VTVTYVSRLFCYLSPRLLSGPDFGGVPEVSGGLEENFFHAAPAPTMRTTPNSRKVALSDPPPNAGLTAAIRNAKPASAKPAITKLRSQAFMWASPANPTTRQTAIVTPNARAQARRAKRGKAEPAGRGPSPGARCCASLEPPLDEHCSAEDQSATHEPLHSAHVAWGPRQRSKDSAALQRNLFVTNPNPNESDPNTDGTNNQQYGLLTHDP
jgi:hypothetical protein